MELLQLMEITRDPTLGVMEHSLILALRMVHQQAHPETSVTYLTSRVPSKYQVCLAYVALFLCPSVKTSVSAAQQSVLEAITTYGQGSRPGPIELLQLLLALCPGTRRVRDLVSPVARRLALYMHNQVNWRSCPFPGQVVLSY